jgi:hypothetical protein
MVQEQQLTKYINNFIGSWFMKNILFLLCSLLSANTFAGARTGHHGDFIVTCHPPKFMQEKPLDNAQVSSFQEFEFMTSDNTDGKTIKVWVNNKLLDVDIVQLPSGHYRVKGKLPEPLLEEGKAWIKVTSESNDGCNALRAWNVYIKK